MTLVDIERLYLEPWFCQNVMWISFGVNNPKSCPVLETPVSEKKKKKKKSLGGGDEADTAMETTMETGMLSFSSHFQNVKLYVHIEQKPHCCQRVVHNE